MEVKFVSDKVIRIKNTKKSVCPTCKKDTVKIYSPFCSKKCSDIDLMKWINNEDNEINAKY